MWIALQMQISSSNINIFKLTWTISGFWGLKWRSDWPGWAKVKKWKKPWTPKGKLQAAAGWDEDWEPLWAPGSGGYIYLRNLLLGRSPGQILQLGFKQGWIISWCLTTFAALQGKLTRLIKSYASGNCLAVLVCPSLNAAKWCIVGV